MFDNPKRNLRDLDAQLRSVEPVEAFPEPEEDREEDVLSPGWNPAVDFGRMAYADEVLEEADVLLKEKKTRPGRASRKAEDGKGRKKRKKRRPLGLQYLLAIGEILLIIAIVRWWLQWIQ